MRSGREQCNVGWTILLCAAALCASACSSSDDDAATDAAANGAHDDAGDPTDAGGAANPLDLDLALCDPEKVTFTAEVDNPYFPLVVDSVHVLEGLEGGTSMAGFRTTVLADTVEVGGVETRVNEKGPSLAGDTSPPELSFFAQAEDGTVCLFGEDEGADGALEWEAGVGGYVAVVFMPAEPKVGMVFDAIYGPDGGERSEITHVGTPTETPAGTFDDTVTVLEEGPSIKKYARGIGEIYDDGIELISY